MFFFHESPEKKFQKQEGKNARLLERWGQDHEIEFKVVATGIYLPEAETEQQRLLYPLRGFIMAPTIIVNGVGSKDGMIWAMNTLTSHDEFLAQWLNTNRLRINQIMGVSLIPDILEPLLDESPKASSVMNGIVSKLPYSSTEYDKMSVPEKISMTREVASGLMTAYKILSEAKP